MGGYGSRVSVTCPPRNQVLDRPESSLRPVGLCPRLRTSGNCMIHSRFSAALPPTLFPPFSLQVLNWHPSIIFDVCDCYIFGKWRGKITASICQGFTCIFQLVIVADKKDVVLLFGKRGELISLLLFSGKIAIIFALGKNQGSNNWIKGVKISASMVNPFPLCGFSFGGYSEGSKCC